MNITTDFNSVAPEYNMPNGGYEWWYFDGQSENGEFRFSIIFYHINPFSTKYIRELDDVGFKFIKHPAISISVYHKSKTIYYSFLEFEEDAFTWDNEKLALRIENHFINYSLNDRVLKVELLLNQNLASGHKLNGIISGEGVLPIANLMRSESDIRHSWHLVLPVMDLNVSLALIGNRGEEKIIFHGMGYHDHNTGFEPMKDSFKEWYWGRYHFGEFTLIYYLMQKTAGRQFEGWMIDKQNKAVLEYFDEANMDYYFRNVFGLNSARKIELKGRQADINIQCFHNIDNGPFYQRFIGDCIIRFNNQVYASQGISEYIYPLNIHKKRYWPLIHMRLRYANQKPHWIQKSKILYPWTW